MSSNKKNTGSPAGSEDEKNWVIEWEAPIEIQKLTPFYRCIPDQHGVRVHVLQQGLWDFKGLANLPTELQPAIVKYFEQNILRWEEEWEGNGGQGIILIVDCAGFALSHYASPRALKLACKQASFSTRAARVIKFGFAVNLNFAAHKVMNMMKPLMGKEMLDKFEFHGSKMEEWAPRILAKIPREQVPSRYGGVMQCE